MVTGVTPLSVSKHCATEEHLPGFCKPGTRAVENTDPVGEPNTIILINGLSTKLLPMFTSLYP